jgi:protoheme IX farnesyltransferase
METLSSEMIPMIGANMIVLPSIAVFPFRPMLSFFLLLGAIIYVGIYTVWLKPRTLLNIVIGGAAGSAAVMSGAAAAGNWSSPAAIVLALIVFLWTPAHFWSLAILYKDDYKNAKIPMLPTIMSDHNAAWWVLVHTLPTAIAALLLGVLPMLGWLYWLLVIPFSVDMVRRNIIFIRQPTKKNARRFFISSNVYLLIVILGVCVASAFNASL